jgi:hypothetical protein
MHKKKASLIPLNYDYSLSSEQEETANEGPFDVVFTPTSGMLSRKVPGRPKSPEYVFLRVEYFRFNHQKQE